MCSHLSVNLRQLETKNPSNFCGEIQLASWTWSWSWSSPSPLTGWLSLVCQYQNYNIEVGWLEILWRNAIGEVQLASWSSRSSSPLTGWLSLVCPKSTSLLWHKYWSQAIRNTLSCCGDIQFDHLHLLWLVGFRLSANINIAPDPDPHPDHL